MSTSEKDLSKEEAKINKERAKEEAKVQKQLATLLDPQSNLLVRSKAFLTFCEIASPQAIEQAFKEHHIIMLSALQDSFNNTESGIKKGRYISEREAKSLACGLEKVLTFLPKDMQDPRNSKFIFQSIEHFLFIENVHAVRKMGLSLLVRFLEVAPGYEDGWKRVIPALNFSTFQNGLQTKVLLPTPLSAPDKTALFVPNANGSVPPPQQQQEEACDMLEYLLTLIEETDQKFFFWYDIVLAIISLLIPASAVEIGIPGAQPNHGFIGDTTPAGLLSIICSHVVTFWLIKPGLLARFLKDESGYQLLFHLFRHGLNLPSKYHEIIEKVLTGVVSFIFKAPTHPLFTPEQFVSLQILFLRELANPFLPKYDKDDEDYNGILSKILEEFGHFLNNFSHLPQSLATEFLRTLLWVAKNLLTPQAQPLNPMTIDKQRVPVTRFVLQAWVGTHPQDEALWGEFYKTMEPLLVYPEIIIQTKTKLLGLTVLICDALYIPRPSLTEKARVMAEKDKKTAREIVCLDLKTTTTAPPRDPDLDMFTWDPANLLRVWYALLRTFQNVDAFFSPKEYEGAMGVIADTLDLLISAENKCQVFEKTGDPKTDAEKSHAPIPLFQVFTPYLFTACHLKDHLRNSGVVIAFGALCRLFVRRDLSVPPSFLARFYEAIRIGLENPDRAVMWTIINSGYNIFSYDLPGCRVLVPDFLNILEEAMLGIVPTGALHYIHDIKKKVAALACSLIHVPCYLKNFSVHKSDDPTSVITAANITDTVQTTLIAAIFSNQVDSESKCMALWGVYTCLCLEFENGSSDKLGPLIRAVLSTLPKGDTQAGTTSLRILSLLSEYADKIPEELINEAIVTICGLATISSTPDAIVVSIFDTLMSWILADIPLSKIRSFTLQELFKVLDYGLSATDSDKGIRDFSAFSLNASNPQSHDGLTILGDQPTEKKQSRWTTLRGTANQTAAQGSMTQPGSTGSLIITSTSSSNTPLSDSGVSGPMDFAGMREAKLKVAAQVFVSWLLHARSRFPSPFGSDDFCSSVLDQDDGLTDESFVNWRLADGHIFSIAEMPHDAEAKNATTRLIIRDEMGKWVWDMTPANVLEDAGLSAPTTAIEEDAYQPEEANEPTQPIRMRTHTFVPQAYVLTRDNNLSGLINGIVKQNADFADWTNSLKDPSIIVKEHMALVQCAETSMMELSANEDAIKTPHPGHKTKHAAEPPARAKCGDVSTPIASRMLLYQLGFVVPESGREESFQRLAGGNRFNNQMITVDKINARSIHKIGLIYVKEGQELQQEILSNTECSDLYRDFAAGLGWKVNLKDHAGYAGGLDRKGEDGLTTRYWSDIRQEVVFHELVDLPLAPNDTKFVGRKRHVGNDHVHIVWSEHCKDYDPHTIVSQFNEAHIVVYPLPSGFFRIQIFRDKGVLPFGPLQNGMIVPKRLLPRLVRETAIDADSVISERRLSWFERQGVCARAEQIHHSMEKISVEETNSGTDVMSLFFGKNPSHLSRGPNQVPSPFLSVASSVSPMPVSPGPSIPIPAPRPPSPSPSPDSHPDSPSPGILSVHRAPPSELPPQQMIPPPPLPPPC